MVDLSSRRGAGPVARVNTGDGYGDASRLLAHFSFSSRFPCFLGSIEINAFSPQCIFLFSSPSTSGQSSLRLSERAPSSMSLCFSASPSATSYHSAQILTGAGLEPLQADIPLSVPVLPALFAKKLLVSLARKKRRKEACCPLRQQVRRHLRSPKPRSPLLF